MSAQTPFFEGDDEAGPNVFAALGRLSETANRIADERNAYLKVGRAMLAALIAAEPDLAAAAKQFGYTPTPLVAVRSAIAAAEAAGIKAEAS